MKPISVIIKANEVDLRGKLLQEEVRATIVPSITRATLAKVASWKEELEVHREEDAGWNWATIVQDHGGAGKAGEGTYEFVTLSARRTVQSLMILETQTHLARRRRKHIVYVEYLAVAPWNCQTIRSPRRFSGCGRALLKFAVARSDELGYDGRVGLHSLAGARPFYAAAGLIDFGPDPAEGGLHYFESPD